jgi:hypothetical protein
MIVHIVRDEGFVAAMGHRVALHLGGEPELKRRCLGTLAQLDDPPDEIQFERLLASRAEAELPPEPAPAAPPINSSAPTSSVADPPAKPRSHKRR